MADIGSDFDTVWGKMLFTIVLGLFVYFALTEPIETHVWLAPTAAIAFPLIIYPLCDVVGSIIQDFIDKKFE